MSNPFSSFFRNLQETEESRIGRLSERIAEGSVNAQKHSDEYSRVNLFTHMYYLQDEPRQKAYNVYSNMSSYFKGRHGGAASSFSSVHFYNEQAKNKRAELVEKYNAEVAVAAHAASN
ncbi:hypothetical protein FRACYDRAFT_259231 [Fragilariopsis cylindrus CCMP1102]|uniref:Uncharacterized protein n=1 Tax=Fragilariopsis cylindrus CCMP1102 TaxID=635003 RepID=A0A1E7FXK0_9STRA|nr:hypothetical protein FRACYDRAFT_259231 [Fragilariopsis cylindrus CCMP1102]|eukprot:OEU22864.1 hypothetical protein FRACYDRAFT_259231 [Fragilariopsis cylindrus CCMP1102]